MAVEYTRSATNFHIVNNRDVRLANAPEITISAWFYPVDTTSSVVVSLSTIGGTARHQIVTSTTLAAITVNSGGTSQSAISGNALGLSKWNHAFCRWAGSSARAVMLNGDRSNRAENTSIVDASSFNRIMIGARINAGTDGGGFQGKIGHVAVWKGLLNFDEGMMLNAGASPLAIRRSTLLYYFPMDRGAGVLQDLVQGARAYPAGSPVPKPATYDGPTIRPPPRSARIFQFAPAVGGATAVPVFRHHYVQQGIG